VKAEEQARQHKQASWAIKPGNFDKQTEGRMSLARRPCEGGQRRWRGQRGQSSEAVNTVDVASSLPRAPEMCR